MPLMHPRDEAYRLGFRVRGLNEMKPGERPPASPPNDGRLPLTADRGATPMHQNRPSHRLGSSILHGARPYVCHEVVIGLAGEMFTLFSVPTKCQNVLGECNKP